MTIRNTLAVLGTVLMVGLLTSAPAQAERDWGVAAWADYGAVLQSAQPIGVYQYTGSAPVPITVTPTLAVGTTTVATLPPVTIQASGIFTPATLAIPADVVAQAQAAGAAQHVATATLTLASTYVIPGSVLPTDPITETATTSLLLQEGAPVTGRTRIVAVGVPRGVKSGAVTYTIPGSWRTTLNPGGAQFYATQLTDTCRLKVSVVARTIRANRIRRQLDNLMLSSKVRRRTAKPVPQTFGARTDGTVYALALSAAPLGGGRYGVLYVGGSVGVGCPQTSEQTDAVLNELERVTRSVRKAR